MTHPNFTTLAEAEQYVATQGVRITASDRESIRKAQEAELHRLTSLKQARESRPVSRLIEGRSTRVSWNP